MSIEFCEYCGAGIGEHRREGEGTCPKCDKRQFLPLPEVLNKFRIVYTSETALGLISKDPAINSIMRSLASRNVSADQLRRIKVILEEGNIDSQAGCGRGYVVPETHTPLPTCKHK